MLIGDFSGWPVKAVGLGMVWTVSGPPLAACYSPPVRRLIL